MPVPDRATVCGLPGAVSVTVKAPVAGPVAVGAKKTGRLQVFPGAICPQPVKRKKPSGTDRLETDIGTVPEFVRLTPWALLVPTAWSENTSPVGLTTRD